MKKSGILIALVLFLVSISSSVHGETTFPVDEAKLIAYVNVGNVDLERLASVFYDVRTLNNQYILGTVAIMNNDNKQLVNAYVGADGWIIAYIPTDGHRADIFYWYGKDYYAAELFPTVFDKTIEKLSLANGNDFETLKDNIKYYDLEFPEAESLTVIIDGGNYLESFSILIPHEITLYDATLSVASPWTRAKGCCCPCFEFWITGYPRIQRLTGNQTSTHSVMDKISRDETVWFNSKAPWGGDLAQALVLLYSLPSQ